MVQYILGAKLSLSPDFDPSLSALGFIVDADEGRWP